MDLSDDLRTDFYDFINPKLEPGTIGLTPVAFIDSVDYINSVTDSNNNLGGGNGSTNMKSFLDEMLFEANGGNIILNGGSTGSTTNSSPSANSNGDETEHVGLPSINSTFELMGSFQWSNLSNGTLTDSTSDSSHTQWLSSPETEVTTLTNLLDPLFVSYDSADISSMNLDNAKQYFATTLASTANTNGSSVTTNSAIVSSNQITTTFHNDSTSKSYLSSPSETIILNGGDHEIIWQKQNSPNSPFIYCDESLLRSALQTGKPEGGTIIQSGNINLNITSGKTSNSNSTMTELRKVLDYPPLSVNSDTTSTQSPSSTSTTSPTPSTLLENHINIRQPTQFEFKMVDPMFHSQIETIIIDESNIPNVEELIMTRIDTKNTKKMEISERKINSTTLSTKWTYATNTQSKSPKRRRTKQGAANAELKQNSNADHANETNNENSISHNSENSRSPSNSNNINNGTSRKERSLHYCNICNKGFKDKYSVNVHVRTHTGEKPFGCYCGKHFRQKAHLAKHHQTHAAKANGHPGKGKRASS